jgi:biopolymer transport protein TolQ
MQVDLSYVDLVLKASLPVKIVMALLVLASIVSLAMIFERMATLHRARKRAYAFEDLFWAGEASLGEIYRHVTTQKREAIGMAAIFAAGFREFARLKKDPAIDPRSIVEGARRSMQVAMNRELDTLESHLSFLATVGSTSPYVGLFGTVWGIMTSFQALGQVKQATLAMVAPGISEALIATAMGLVAAIPAVIAYNRFSHDVERLSNRYEDFLDEFTTILQRHAHARPGETASAEQPPAPQA